MMTPVLTDENRAEILKKYYEVADARPFNPDALREFFTGDLIDHDAHDEGSNIESVVGTFASLAEGAPDSKHDLKIVEPAGNDLVIVYWKYHGTHTGDLLGLPASNKTFNISGSEIYKITDGKISQLWHVEDIAGLMSQLGFAKE